jgi:hypothetical protein
VLCCCCCAVRISIFNILSYHRQVGLIGVDCAVAHCPGDLVTGELGGSYPSCVLIPNYGTITVPDLVNYLEV